MAQHVTRLFGDQSGGFEDIALGRVFFPDRFQLFIRAVAKHVLEETVQRGAILHRPFGGPAFI